MFKYLKKYWFWCLLAPLFMVGEIMMDLVQPDLMKTIVDEGVIGKNMDIIINVGLRMVILVFIGAATGILCGVFANIGSQRFGNDLRKDVFKRIMNLSFQQTDKFSTGSLVTRLSNDVTQIQNTVNMAMRMAVRSLFMFIGGIFMLYRQSPTFMLITACGLPIVVFFVIFFSKKAAPLFKIVQERLDSLNNVMQEDVAGARVVKAYVKEDYEMERFDKANQDLVDISLKVFTRLAFMGPILNIVLNTCIILIIVVGGITVQNNGDLTTGEIMASLTYVSMILFGVMFVSHIFQMIPRVGASIARINEVLYSDEVVKSGNIKETKETKGKIELRNVSFAYPNSSGQNVLEDIDLTINPGETLAILGATGSGKSSLVNLIPRFYDVKSGEVLIDGINVKDYDLKALRNRIAIVLQKAELYSRPIEANIRFGKDDADPHTIKKAASIAQADDFICDTHDGYFTFVTEGGHSLSGGQKQRISISRAVIKDADILIFDDSTSALDLKTEARLYKALNTEYPDVTKIIIAQRIASVRNADRIAVLENGRISACAPHDELMETSEIYRDIYYSQLKDDSIIDEEA